MKCPIAVFDKLPMILGKTAGKLHALGGRPASAPQLYFSEVSELTVDYERSLIAEVAI